MSDTTDFQTIVDIFDRSIQRYADRELFGTKKGGAWTWTTYREFGKDVERVRAGLAKLGFTSGDKIAVISDNRVEWAVMAYACFTLGVALVPMYEAQNDKDWEFIIRDCEAKGLAVANASLLDGTKKFLDSIPSLKHIFVFEGFKPNGSADRVHPYASLLETDGVTPAIDRKKEDTACIIYTSGTTGNPKGVILSHYNIASNVAAIHKIFVIELEDRSLSFLPWAHSFGQTVELHGLFSAGASIGICESVNKILDNLAEVRPTLLFSVPRIFNKIYSAVQKQISEKPKAIQTMVKMALRAAEKMRDGKAPTVAESLMHKVASKLVFEKVRAKFGGRLKYAFSGGAAISPEVAGFIDGIGITVYEGYGLTETSPIATANWPGSRRIGSVGKPVPEVIVDIDTVPTDGKKNDQGYDEGEIVIYGPNVMQGYYNRPEENAAVFLPEKHGKGRGFRTGDMGYKDKDGFIFISGRIKEQYKLENGKYVVPTPLEEQLKLSPFLLNVMVYGDNRPYNVALVVVNVEALRNWAEKDAKSLPTGTDELLQDATVRTQIGLEIKKYSEAFKGFEAVHGFGLIAEDFTTENGMLTPSLKLKRRAVMDRYGELIANLYKKPKDIRANA